MILEVILILVASYLYWTTRKHDYWKKKNVVYEQPLPLVGNSLWNIFGFISIQDLSEQLYRKYPNEQVVGTYRGVTPELIIRDLDIVRHILNTDFSYFHRRGLGRNVEVEPLQKNIFSSEGDTWKLLRQKQTPVFTTAKLKSMFPLIIKCAEKLYSVGDNIIAKGGVCDIRELMARFATEFIGDCGFGIEMDVMNEENSHFRYIGKKITNPPLRSIIMMGLYELFPELRGFIHVDHPDVENTMFKLVNTVSKQRNYKPIGRNDFIDIMLEQQCQGKIKGESIEKFNADGTPTQAEIEMDTEVLAAQVFVFFIAGFETSSTTTSYTLHELAHHPDIQEKVHEEIDRVLAKHDNKLSYNVINELSYLDMAMKEALRKFPPVGILNRECAKEYTLPKSNITLDPGTKIIIPIQAIQNDGTHFENPEKFIPERFLPENVQNRHKFAYLPFGEGPRMCIGARLGQMQALAGLTAFLSKFSVEPAPTTEYKLIKDQTVNILQGVKGGLPLKITHRKNYKI